MWSTSELVELRETLKMVTSTNDNMWFHTSQNFNFGRNFLQGRFQHSQLLHHNAVHSLSISFILLSHPQTHISSVYLGLECHAPSPRHKELAPIRDVSTQSAVAPWSIYFPCALPGNIVTLDMSFTPLAISLFKGNTMLPPLAPTPLSLNITCLAGPHCNFHQSLPVSFPLRL